MAITIKNSKDLKKHVDAACGRAVENAAKEVRDKLYDCINIQYYRDPYFYPNVYKRTKTFLKHAAYMMLTSNTAQIYIDIEGMHYKNNFDSWQVVKWASESKHGSDLYQTPTTDFWTQFIEWCNEDLLKLLKENLRKQGLNVK